MGLVNMNIISKIKKERKYLPLEMRLQMHEDVHELRKAELSYRQIQREIRKKYGKQLPKSTIGVWINRKHHPLGKVNKFDGKSSPELSYVIGTILGDGSIYFSGEDYRLELSVKDKEFAEEFGKCLAKILRKNKPYKPRWSEKGKRWTVEVRSILLYKFLSRSLEELKMYIEHSRNCASTFLRALFDGEACSHVNAKRHRRELKLCNTNIELLNYAKYLLKRYFNINATGPHFNKKAIKNCYHLYIRANSLFNFYKYIGFTIKRKQQKLIEAIKQ
ncbi:MAG: LAGLIDADG family homing endonuclease [Nitrososphaerota archaeon]